MLNPFAVFVEAARAEDAPQDVLGRDVRYSARVSEGLTAAAEETRASRRGAVAREASSALARTRSAVWRLDSYQPRVTSAATSRPPRPKARPKASDTAATSPMNSVLTRFAAMPTWLTAMITAKAMIAIWAIRPSSVALVNPIWPAATSIAPRTKRARTGATSRTIAATIRFGIQRRI